MLRVWVVSTCSGECNLSVLSCWMWFDPVFLRAQASKTLVWYVWWDKNVFTRLGLWTQADNTHTQAQTHTHTQTHTHAHTHTHTYKASNRKLLHSLSEFLWLAIQCRSFWLEPILSWLNSQLEPCLSPRNKFTLVTEQQPKFHRMNKNLTDAWLCFSSNIHHNEQTTTMLFFNYESQWLNTNKGSFRWWKTLHFAHVVFMLITELQQKLGRQMMDTLLSSWDIHSYDNSNHSPHSTEWIDICLSSSRCFIPNSTTFSSSKIYHPEFWTEGTSIESIQNLLVSEHQQKQLKINNHLIDASSWLLMWYVSWCAVNPISWSSIISEYPILWLNSNKGSVPDDRRLVFPSWQIYTSHWTSTIEPQNPSEKYSKLWWRAEISGSSLK